MPANAQAFELSADNTSRLAIFDALHEHDARGGPRPLTERELFDRVIWRLRLLMPRELQLAGERAYVRSKLEACAVAGLLSIESPGEEWIVALTGKPPLVRYPDGALRGYTPGLERAREQLSADNGRLRAAGFDVRALIPTCADMPDGPEFQALLSSMREHGFLRQFWIEALTDGVIVDGRARKRAAEVLDLDVEYIHYQSDRKRTAARRRDTPLNRVMLALQSNLARLSPAVIASVHDAVAAVTGRPWQETAADLELTALWRRSPPAEYSPCFEVRKLPIRPGAEARVQVTPDRKVMVRSLIEAAGLSNYKLDLLREFVPFERARSIHSAGRKAVFARAEDLIAGIAAMQLERRASRRKLDPEWDEIQGWLTATFRPAAG